MIEYRSLSHFGTAVYQQWTHHDFNSILTAYLPALRIPSCECNTQDKMQDAVDRGKLSRTFRALIALSLHYKPRTRQPFGKKG